MITPADSPSSPGDYANVAPHGLGPAPYDIMATPLDLTPVFDAATAVSGAGVLYPQGPRQQAAGVLMNSPAGEGATSVLAGSAGGGGESWPADVRPGAV